ncbi:MAG: hypothetical protein U0837_18235 [Dehalococcoidia bacterium]|jgi:hypothetical protein
MERLLTTLLGSALVLAGCLAVASLTAKPAVACTLGPFSVSHLADSARATEVVAIGTFGEPRGAAIEFNVETYFKAPASKAETLLVNNLAQTTTPACEPVLTHLAVHEPGERALLLLNRDDNGVGANWIPTLRGTVLIRDDAVQSFEDTGDSRAPRQAPMSEVRAVIESALGPSGAPRSGLAEVPVQPVGNFRCVYGPYTLRWFAANAPVIATGTVEAADARTATIRVTTGFYGVASGETLRIDNRYWDAGHAITTCEESASPGPKYNVGDSLLLFLNKEGSRDLQGLRAAGVDGIGIYPTSAIDDQSGREYSLSDAVKEIHDLTVERPESAVAAGVVQYAVVEQRTNDVPLWGVAVISAVIGGLAGAAGAGVWMRAKRAPR